MNESIVALRKPWERRVVLILDDARVIDMGSNSPEYGFLESREVMPVKISQAIELMSECKVLGGSRPFPGMILVLSPFDDSVYAELSQARDFVALEKHSAALRLFQHLGSKVVKVTNVRMYDRESAKELSIDVQTRATPAKGKLHMKKEELENIKRKMNLRAEFPGGKPDIAGATRHLELSRLDTDPVLREIIKLRQSENPLKSITQEICLTESLQSTFEFIASLALPQGLVKASYTSTIKEKIEISQTLAVEFPD